jgi:hypothetical protein
VRNVFEDPGVATEVSVQRSHLSQSMERPVSNTSFGSIRSDEITFHTADAGTMLTGPPRTINIPPSPPSFAGTIGSGPHIATAHWPSISAVASLPLTTFTPSEEHCPSLSPETIKQRKAAFDALNGTVNEKAIGAQQVVHELKEVLTSVPESGTSTKRRRRRGVTYIGAKF